MNFVETIQKLFYILLFVTIVILVLQMQTIDRLTKVEEKVSVLTRYDFLSSTSPLLYQYLKKKP